jgi:tripartite-type tricarboxylate transporter receptor subunit TctC
MAIWIRLVGIVALGCWLNAPAPARAQSLVQRPIKIVVPSTAGSPNDVMARLIADPLDGHPGSGRNSCQCCR